MMEKVDEKLSAKFANMAFVCACLVASIHVCGEWRVVANGIAQIAVPFFFLASGFFLAGHTDEKGWWRRETLKRVRTLLVPLAFWCVFGTLWGALWTAIANHLAGRPLGDSISFCNGEWVPGVGILWFMRTLFGYVVISPIIVWTLRRFGWLLPMGLYVIYWTVYSFVLPSCSESAYEFLYYVVSLEGLAYFTTGICFRLKEVPSSLRWMSADYCKVPLAFVAIVLLASHLLYANISGEVVVDLKHYHYLFTMWVLFSMMPERRWPKWLVGSAFAIYLLHCQVNVIGQIVVKRLSIDGTLVGFISRWVIVVMGAIVVANLLKRFCPRFAAGVFGGR